MKCKVCGVELEIGEKVCHGCGSPVEEEIQTVSKEEKTEDSSTYERFGDIMEETEKKMAAENTVSQPEPTIQPPNTKKKKSIVIGAVAAAVVAAGTFAFVQMSQKDPKEVVIDAFENIYTEGQTDPLEELFGVSGFAEISKTADVENTLTIILDDCSEPAVKAWAGSGARVTGRSDRTNQKEFANVGIIYKDMDLVNVDVYYGDHILMMAVPEISSKVFTMDLGDGLAQRIQESPLLGPVLEESGVDVEGLFVYLEDQIQQAESGQTAAIDFEGIMTRYKEGTRAQEKLKEALVVDKADKETFTIDGQEVNCNGYQVMVSKASMMEFLRTTTDFFLNDQELKDQYLKQLQQSVHLTELMGAGSSGISADEIYTDSMEDMTEAVNDMIDFLDKSLNDVNMTVYVDKKGRLAAVDGSTQMNIETTSMASTEELSEPDIVNIDFEFRLQGGSYLTQNMTADIAMKNSKETLAVSVVKSGAYDGKQVTGDLAVNVNSDGSSKIEAGVTLTGTYNSEGGDYHMGMGITGNNSLIADISMSGVVDQLEKGQSIHADIDEWKITIMDAMTQLTFSGDYEFGPLSHEVTALEGESFDVFAADENQWQSIFMEIYLSAMQLASQISF